MSVLPERHGLVVGHLRDGLLPDVDTESRPVAEPDMAVGQHPQTTEQFLEKTYAVMRGTQVGAHLCVGPQCARLAVKLGQLPQNRMRQLDVLHGVLGGATGVAPCPDAIQEVFGLSLKAPGSFNNRTLNDRVLIAATN